MEGAPNPPAGGSTATVEVIQRTAFAEQDNYTMPGICSAQAKENPRGGNGGEDARRMFIAEMLWERRSDIERAGNIIARKCMLIQAPASLHRPPEFGGLPIPSAIAAFDFIAPSQLPVAHCAHFFVIPWARVFDDPRAFRRR